MTLPKSGQTVHMMTWRDVLRKLRNMEGRDVRELALYTTDDLRRLYQVTEGDIVRLRDGIVSRVQLVAVIRWRIFWARFGYGCLLVMSLLGAFFAFMSWRFPVGNGH